MRKEKKKKNKRKNEEEEEEEEERGRRMRKKKNEEEEEERGRRRRRMRKHSLHCIIIGQHIGLVLFIDYSIRHSTASFKYRCLTFCQKWAFQNISLLYLNYALEVEWTAVGYSRLRKE